MSAVVNGKQRPPRNVTIGYRIVFDITLTCQYKISADAIKYM